MKLILYISLLITATNTIANGLLDNVYDCNEENSQIYICNTFFDYVPNISASDGNYTRYVRISWSKYKGAVGYQLYRGISGRCDDLELIEDRLKETEFSDSQAKLGQKYYYGIKILTNRGKTIDKTDNLDVGHRAVSDDVASNLFLDKIKLLSNSYILISTHASPTVSTVSASDGKYKKCIKIDWEKYEDDFEYQLFRGRTDKGDYLKCISGWQKENYYIDSTAIPKQKYYYGLKIRTPDGTIISETDFDIGYCRPGATELVMPSYNRAIEESLDRLLRDTFNISASDGDYSRYVRINWDRYTEEAFYQLHRGISGKGQDLEPISDWQEENYFLDGEAAIGQKYYYGVKIRKLDGAIIDNTNKLDIGYRMAIREERAIDDLTLYIDIEPVSGIAEAKYNSISFVGNEKNKDYVRIEWYKIEKAAEYQVYRSDINSIDLKPFSKWQKENFYIDSTAVPRQEYHYGVKIRTSDGEVIDMTNNMYIGSRSIE